MAFLYQRPDQFWDSQLEELLVQLEHVNSIVQDFEARAMERKFELLANSFYIKALWGFIETDIGKNLHHQWKLV